MMTLQLLICTFNDGITKVASQLLPPMEGVSYLVSWQQADGYTPCALPEALVRGDVEVWPLEGLGLSRNRNNCLRHATGDLCLICDDDCIYTPDGLHAIMRTCEERPDVDIAVFKSINGSENRVFPNRPTSLREKIKNYSPVSFEIVLRRASIEHEQLRFNEHFGLKSDTFGMGEEDWFVFDALDAGLNVWFFPIVVVYQPGETSWKSRAADPCILMTYGAILCRRYRSTMHLRAPLIAWRMRGYAGGFFHAYRHILAGMGKAKSLFKYCCPVKHF